MLAHQPHHVLVAGCWHADVPWSRKVAGLLPELLPDESPRVILHTGDFGVWSDGDAYLDLLHASLERVDAHLYFVDGNHEDFGLLHYLAGDPDPRWPVPIRPTITWLPRGVRWTWHDRTWLALGGAVSVDRVARSCGVDWFPEEEITEAQTHRVLADGRADVMLCHDAPAAVPLRLPAPPSWWHRDDLDRSARHRERLQAIVDAVQPAYLIHGHYHLEHVAFVNIRHGPLAVVGLDKNNTAAGNYRVLDTRVMQVVSRS